MVFTCRVHRDATPSSAPVPGPARLRRRTLLGGAGGGLLALGAAGCGPFDDGPGSASAPAELAGVLAAAVTLASGYQATLLAQPGLADRLNPLLADHSAHISALLTATGQPTSPAPTATVTPSAVPGDQAAALAQLRAAEQSAQVDAVAACVAAPAGYAALLGSIAACRASHVEALA